MARVITLVLIYNTQLKTALLFAVNHILDALSSPDVVLFLVSSKNRDLLEGPILRSMRRVIVSYSQPIRFVEHDPGHAQSDEKSVSRGLPVLDLPIGRDSWERE